MRGSDAGLALARSRIPAHILEKAAKRCEGRLDVVKEMGDYFFQTFVVR